MKRPALLLGALVALGSVTPALAVDRSLGKDVPKPAVTGTPWSDAEIAALDANLDATLGDASLHGAHVGVYAIDARDGRVLYARNADDAFQPASTFKLLVGSAALDKLGPQWRAHTTLTTSGTVDAHGNLDAPLVLTGGGDPLLSASDLDAAAAAVAKAHVTHAAGLLIDNGVFDQQRYGLGWNWDDFPYYYAPKISGMMLEDDVLHFTVTPGASVGAPASIAWSPAAAADEQRLPECPPASDDIHLVNEAVTGAAGSKDGVDLVWGPCGLVHVAGSIPLGAKPDTFDGAVPSPERYVQRVFTAALAAHGVTVPLPVDLTLYGAPTVTTPPAPAAGHVLWSHQSEPLSDLLSDMWLPSDNLVAESLLKQIAVADAGAPGTDAHGIAWEKTWLAAMGVDVDAMAIVDGSGLSGYDRITPRDVVTILRHDWNGPYRDLVLDDLPLTGVRGTLASSWLGTPAEKRVFAKTGSISHVNTLAGYAANAKHGAVIFAFYVDDRVGAYAPFQALRGRVLAHFVED